MPRDSKLPLLPAIKDFIADHLLDDKPRRLHISKDPIEKFISKRQRVEMKPTGIWYGINESWFEWMMSAGCNWFQPYIYEVIVDEERVLRIPTLKEFDAFEEEYGALPPYMQAMQEAGLGFMQPAMMRKYSLHIDWPRLSKQYSALEITPYLYQRRLESIWYNVWDCASGCIWSKKGLKELRLFAEYNHKQKRYVLK